MQENYSTSRVIISGDRPEVRYTIAPSLVYKYFYIESVSFPTVWDIFQSFSITFVDGASVSHDIPVISGSYLIFDLTDYIKNQMNVLYPAGAPYTASLTDNFRWTIQSTAGEFSLSTSSPVAAQRLGLRGVVNSSGGLLVSEKYYMSPTNINIETNIPIDGQSISYDNLTPAAQDVTSVIRSGSSFTASIALANSNPGGFSDVLTAAINSGSFGTHHKLLGYGINNINIRITDELGSLLDIYPQRWTIVFVFYNSRDGARF